MGRHLSNHSCSASSSWFSGLLILRTIITWWSCRRPWLWWQRTTLTGWQWMVQSIVYFIYNSLGFFKDKRQFAGYPDRGSNILGSVKEDGMSFPTLMYSTGPGGLHAATKTSSSARCTIKTLLRGQRGPKHHLGRRGWKNIRLKEVFSPRLRVWIFHQIDCSPCLWNSIEQCTFKSFWKGKLSKLQKCINPSSHARQNSSKAYR